MAFSIIPSPGTPGVAANTTVQPLIDHDFTVNAGQTLYTTTLDTLFANDGLQTNYSTFTNAGSLWNVETGRDAFIIYAFNFGTIVNQGLTVAQSTDNDAAAYFVESTFQGGLTNTGRIYAIAPQGTAIGESDWSPNPTVLNSGLIAAQGRGAYAVERWNGGAVVNGATGDILAEGGAGGAVAVYLGRGHFGDPGHADVNNAGLIEAASTDPSVASVAIDLSSLDVENMTVLNSGRIVGDYAIYVDDGAFSPPAKSPDYVVNTSSGEIDGEISLGLGDDHVTNQGQIVGYVDMGDGNDVFDNTAGRLTGTADMGLGNDTFLGGAGADAVVGGRGDDLLIGNGGNDLLLGGRGNDTLIGGAGNDGLYGETGDDTITTQGGDHVEAGSGNDTVILGDLQFASVDGGVGYDKLVLPTLAHPLDLQAALAAGRIAGFEELDLTGAQTVVVRPGDVPTLTGGSQLVIAAGQGSQVDLVGVWTQGATQTIAGVAYATFTSGGETVLVSGAGAVSILGAPPAGAAGLDAVAAGAAAPLPGSTPGADLAASVTQVSDFVLSSSLAIEADETWTTPVADGVTVIAGPSYPIYALSNAGTITSSGGLNGARSVAGDFLSFTNTGTVTATVTGDDSQLSFNQAHYQIYGISGGGYDDAVAVVAEGYSVLTNSGLIKANAQAGAADAAAWSVIHNSGTIAAVSSELYAIGAAAPTVDNSASGVISADGVLAAYGIAVNGGGETLDNEGLISAVAHGGKSYGVFVTYGGGASNIVNNGTITADVAIETSVVVNYGVMTIDNGGQINGQILLDLTQGGGGSWQDLVLNHGAINGDIHLGGERDVYIGTGGQEQGVVYGEDGDDLLVGGAGADHLDGGTGDDILQGAAGADILTGGAGHDTFVYRSLADSTAAGFDTITDFETGVDHIDLTALSVSSVDLVASGAVTVLTAHTAQGDLVIHVQGAVAQSDLLLTPAATVQGTESGDALIAAAGGGTVQGGAGDDLLIGSSGNDRLDGGAGSDLMFGGAGNDTYVVDATDGSTDVVRELSGQGVDTIEVHLGPYNSVYALPDNVENLTLFTNGGGHELFGNALDNTITGSAYADIIHGGAGADRMVGGAGDDTYYVDDPNDVVVENPNEGTDLVNTTTSWVMSDNVEKLTVDPLAGPVTITGNASANTITGNDAGDVINAGDGDDTVTTGAGADQIHGGAGADHIVSGLGADVVYGDDGNDQIWGDQGADVLYGGAGDDHLTGNSPIIFDLISEVYRQATPDDDATDILDGGPGNDVLDGQGGRDIALYQVASTVASWTHNADGTWTVNAGSDGVDTLTSVEVLRFTDRDVSLSADFTGQFDANGDTYADVLFRDASGQLASWQMKDLAISSGGAIGNPGAGWTLVAEGDINGDGQSDLIFRNAAGVLADWTLTATGIGADSGTLGDPGAGWSLVGVGDFNGDNISDLLFRGPDGSLATWDYGRPGATAQTPYAPNRIGGGNLGSPGASWAVKAVADFDGDGKADILFENAAGQYAVWTMHDTTIAQSSQLGSPGAGWSFAGTGDFNGDGKADVLFENASGQYASWDLNGGSIVGGGNIGAPGSAWTLVQIGDFNGDGKSDLMFRNTDGTLATWDLSDTAIVGGGTVGNPGSAWSPVGGSHGQGFADLVFANSNGTWATWMINGGQIVGGGNLGTPGSQATQVLGDFNGDGSRDVAFQGANGSVSTWLTDGAHVIGGTSLGNPGAGWTLVASGDFNGDGQSDLLFRNASGQLATWDLHGNAIVGGGALGSPGSSYVFEGVGDLNGDGKADILFKNATTGTYAAWLMNDTQIVSGGDIGNPGGSWSFKALGDLNGDGKADMLFEDASGEYASWDLNGTQIIGGGDIGAPHGTWSFAGLMDLNGDGRADILFQDANGNLASWTLNDNHITGGATFGNPGAGWHLIG
ncbi:FG-GAP-like repeat-containing protein [Caulobacter sp. KR2-114]|uniref:FG-GAP-like repeat-containing protein n=1 Tax=Caulobacter sp. KR2-114 TaxID=3400912 RepID=UPI003C05DAA5